MWTTPEDYNKFLFQIQDSNKPKQAILIPQSEKIYDINLNTREIIAPEFLSVEKDHYAETIYFKVNRYFDNMDLTNTVCLIQYINHNAKTPEGEKDLGHVFVVPYYDAITYKNEDKILLPWCIEGAATVAAGPISFSFRFYKMDKDLKFIYNLNTLPADSKILYGMNVISDESDEFPIIPQDKYQWIIQEIQMLKDTNDIYWVEIKR